MDGWVKLHRKFLEWEWYGVPNMVTVWIHLLLSANWEDKNWHGMTIGRGQLVCSLASLAEETGLSVQQIRTSLSNLQKTKEINKQTTNKYTIITICNFDRYQVFEDALQQAEQQTNNTQPNKQITTPKEIKKKEEKKERDTKVSPKKESLVFPFSSPEFKSAWDALLQEKKWRDKSPRAYQMSLNKLGKYDERFAIELINTAIERNYQGVVFQSTDSDYEEWKKKHAKRDDSQFSAARVLGKEYREWMKSKQGQIVDELFK